MRKYGMREGLGLGGALLAFAVLAAPGLSAQETGRGRSREALVAKLTGKKVRVDAATGARRAITEQEAGALIDQIAVLTTPTASGAEVALPKGGAMLSLSGHGAGHVLVAKPNDDGTSSVRCVTSADEAVEFLADDVDESWPVQ